VKRRVYTTSPQRRKERKEKKQNLSKNINHRLDRFDREEEVRGSRLDVSKKNIKFRKAIKEGHYRKQLTMDN
jgi:hypothetical protein